MRSNKPAAEVACQEWSFHAPRFRQHPQPAREPRAGNPVGYIAALGRPVECVLGSTEVRSRRPRRTYDGRALLAKDSAPDVRAAAAERMAARIQNLEFTLRAGILNGDLVTNTPENMTPAEANARIRTFFADLDGYQRTHAAQIAELKTLNPTELRWRGVTHSEANVTAALDAIDQSGNSTLSERWGGRASLGTAIQEANQGGRLPLSEHTAARVRTAFNPEMPLTIVRPGPATTAPELAGSAGRAGAAEGAAEAAAARGQITGARVLGGRGCCRTGRGLRHHRPPRGRVAQRGQQRRRKIRGHPLRGAHCRRLRWRLPAGRGVRIVHRIVDRARCAGYRAAGRRGRWLRR